MVSENKFTWAIENFSSSLTEWKCSDHKVGNEDDQIRWVIQNFNTWHSSSELFVIGGCTWCLMLERQSTYMSLLRMIACSVTFTPGWRIHAKYRLTVVNQLSEKLSLVQETQCWCDEKTQCMDFPELIPFTLLADENGGFLVNNEVKIVVEIDVLEVIGILEKPLKRRKLEETSSVDVNGFHVLPSQVEFVSRVFNKYPDIALQLRAKNELMRTSCLYVFLSLIETLCKSLGEVSNDKLVEAANSLSYLKNSGFKVDWLEKKVEEVKENKKEEQVGLAQKQEVEETFKIFKQKCVEKKSLVKKEKAELKKLKQKCSEIEARLEREIAKVDASRAPALRLDISELRFV